MTPSKAKAKPLTTEQKQIIKDNRGKFPTKIAALKGMEGATPRQISDFLRQHPEGTRNEHEELADHLEQYIQQNGLPAKHGGVMDYIKYLKGKA